MRGPKVGTLWVSIDIDLVISAVMIVSRAFWDMCPILQDHVFSCHFWPCQVNQTPTWDKSHFTLTKEKDIFSCLFSCYHTKAAPFSIAYSSILKQSHSPSFSTHTSLPLDTSPFFDVHLSDLVLC